MISKENISLKDYNTFGIDVKASRFAEICALDDVVELHNSGAFKSSFLLLGGGSNILFSGDFHGLVIKNNIKGIRTQELENAEVIVTAGAGVEWNELVWHCIDHNYGGIENLSLIPGSVGAAPIQNIGAYGVELKDCFEMLEAFDIGSGKVIKFFKEECEFGYRDSIFKKERKGKYVILSVSLKLKIGKKPDTSYGAIVGELSRMGVDNDPGIRDVGLAVSSIRDKKLPDPDEKGNAGSFFKNPLVTRAHFLRLINEYPDIPHYPDNNEMEKLPAGWLIEQCGWKGKRRGDAGVHDKQALVLVNHANASATEVLSLAADIQRSVLDRFGVDLEMEVNVV